MARNKKSANKLKKLVVMTSLCGILLVVGTYAWFIGMQSVSVSQFDVKIAVTEGLALSMNAVDWTTEGELNAKTATAYTGNTNTWAEDGLIPLSSVGDTNKSKSEMILFEKASLTATEGGYRLLSSPVVYPTTTPDELTGGKGYVAFDLFIRNRSGEEYYATNNVLNEEAIYLTTGSAVTVSETGGAAGHGIENSVRVGFVQIGRVQQDKASAAQITGITCNDDTTNGVTGICRTATIWEPNDTDHVQNAINWYKEACQVRTGITVSDDASYSTTACTTINNDTAYPTYAVANKLDVGSNVDVYDGEAFNTYKGTYVKASEYFKDGHNKTNDKLVEMDYFTDTEKDYTGVNRPTFMTLAPNSVTKVRVYIWIEGQDIDNYDFASLGQQITVSFGFTKERFTQEEIASPSA